MVSVTIRITTQQEAGETDFDVHLIEEDGTETAGVLKRADLTTGRWTANVGRGSPPAATDIVSHVAGVAPDRRSHPDYEDIAKALYEWLLPTGALRQRWSQLGNPRVYVETLVDALERLPWEMACPATPPRHRPALIGGLCRLTPQGDHHVAAPAANRRSTWPFRILIVIGCTADEEDGLNIGKEVDAIERTFHPLGRTVDVHCMRRPTHTDMMVWIGRFQPHVFHFAGHGIKVPGVDQYGLRIENADRAWTWFSDTIDVDLPRKRWVPTFVFLNACRSAAEQNGSWSTHRSFLAAGAKAVLGMQADIGGSLAGDFAAAMYKGLATGASLEDAMKSGTRGHSRCPRDISWALPAMTVSERNAKLFVPQPLPADESYEKCAEFEDARLFANCREPRRDFTHWAYPCVTRPGKECTSRPRRGELRQIPLAEVVHGELGHWRRSRPIHQGARWDGQDVPLDASANPRWRSRRSRHTNPLSACRAAQVGLPEIQLALEQSDPNRRPWRMDRGGASGSGDSRRTSLGGRRATKR